MTDRTPFEEGRTDTDQLLDCLLSDHHTGLLRTMDEAIDTFGGAAALRRGMQSGLPPKLFAGPPAEAQPSILLMGDADSLARALAAIHDLRELMLEICDESETLDVSNMAWDCWDVLDDLSVGLEDRTLTQDEAHELFSQFELRLAQLLEAMQDWSTWAYAPTLTLVIGNLPELKRTVMHLFDDADDNVSIQN